MRKFKFNKKTIGILIASLFVLWVLCIPVDDDTVATEPEVAQTADVVESAVPQSDVDENEDVDVDAIVEEFKECFADSFVSYTYDEEENLLMINLKFDGMTDELMTYGATEDWYKATAAIDKVTYVMSDKYGVGVAIMVLNDRNTDNVLYSSVNGIKVYDVTEDFE